MSDEKTNLRGIDPTKPFYLAASVGNSDGSIDHPEGMEGVFDNEKGAVDVLKELNEQYADLEGYVFYCVPVKRIWRGKTKVTKVTK